MTMPLLNTLFHKIKKRLGKTASRLISHNTRFRPHTVCRLDANVAPFAFDKELTVHHVYPRHITTLDIPEELYQACSTYWKPSRQVETDYMVTEVPNGRICTDNESCVAIITSHNRLLDNVSLNLKDGKVTDAGFHTIFEQRYFTPPVKLSGTVFSMLTGGAGLNNISHWFLDVLPRLHLLHKSGLFSKVDWFLVPSLQYEYQRETLQLLDIPKEKLIAGDKFPHLTADSIIASTAPRGNHTLVPTWACSFIKESFLPIEGADTVDIKENYNIYISRSDSKIRNIRNEAELESTLGQLRFETIVSSKLSVKEKVALFSKVNRVVSATGAGLINLMFCKPGTQVLEIFNEGFVVEPFYDIATKMGLDYNFIICRSGEKILNMNQGQREDLTVDVDVVTEKLLDMTATGKKGNKVQNTASPFRDSITF